MAPPAFKPAYLICGDDHGRIAERRARLRSLAEKLSGAAGIEVLEGDDASPDRVASTLGAMTLALGHRFVIVDGAERFKDKELDALVAALAALASDTTVAFFAREDGRARAPERLHEAVQAAGGQIDAENSVKPWELPKWAIARAAELGIELDAEGARALVAHVGERQQRMLRELEKLALGRTADTGQPLRLSAAEVTELTAGSAERRSWTVADALVAGDAQAAVSAYLGLREQGERLAGLIYWIAQRLRAALDVALALDAGESAAQVRRRLRMPGSAAERLIADARRTGADRLATAITELADLELASRGGRDTGALNEDTAAVMAFRRIAA